MMQSKAAAALNVIIGRHSLENRFLFRLLFVSISQWTGTAAQCTTKLSLKGSQASHNRYVYNYTYILNILNYSNFIIHIDLYLFI